jgi:hypothetical protein|tara:strand:+ start:504 stop:1079 length:576 start_codon:yes stop_codon:yes gene_type:complete
MIKQNVNIVNFNTLYEILEEIKENLSFNITKYENEKDLTKHKSNDLEDSLIIINSNKKNLGKKNSLVFNELPISLGKLIELINISLIKMRFNRQSHINIKKYKLNLNSKIFSKNKINLKLTEKEIEIILYLDSKKNKQNVLDLQKNIWKYSPDLETHTVETHIYRLRKKINDKFNDKDFIISDSEGYFIEK